MDDLSAIIENLKKSIVIIKLSNGKSGTGFFVNDKGLLVTNKHIVQLSTFIRITLANDKELDATVVFSNNDYDFSFAAADIDNSLPIKLADSSALKEGKPVIAIGHPFGYDFTVSKGIISCKNRIVKGIDYIQTDVPINPGNSGGPLVNQKGEAVGMNTGVVNRADNMSFAVPVNAPSESAYQSYQSPNRPGTGIWVSSSIAPYTTATLNANTIPQGSRLRRVVQAQLSRNASRP